MNSFKKVNIDLAAYMADCEANYWRIMRLFDIDEESVTYHVSMLENTTRKLRFQMVQRCKFTTMLVIEISGCEDWLATLEFEVRLYHDAKMAEVFSFQRQGRVFASNPYPNADMIQKDEKIQQNRFLSECLVHCLKNGLAEKAPSLF